ncbi:hypothetical protein JD844_025494 [Phrynosoma platyrhinos]|uniref:Uncharacterized protein n=1 Tax=Phrynosoma platyrhinos TaxID=52577 RepID=A0ABQ7SZI1_PHRPL|nr:hypothetical protein JD844_025494 [Phrynosoma platyrhinos]
MVSRTVKSNTFTSPENDGAHPLRSIKFNPTVGRIQIAEHMDIKFNCSISVPKSLINQDSAVISLWKNGKELLDADRIASQYYQFDDNEDIAMISTFSINNVQRSDNGSYRCKLKVNSDEIVSGPILVLLEGLPYFIKQPQGLNVTRNTPFNLTCEAVGPPEPVEIRWHWNSSLISKKEVSPSVLIMPGIPSPPVRVSVQNRTAHMVVVSWVPGSDGYSPLSRCSVQVKEVVDADNASVMIFNTSTPPHQYHIPNLRPLKNYSICVSCMNEVGWSGFSPWIMASTTEGAPSAPPGNVTLSINESSSSVIITWIKPPATMMNGELQGYSISYTWQNSASLFNALSEERGLPLICLSFKNFFPLAQHNHSSHVDKDTNAIHIPIVATNATCIVRVAAVTNGGVGPFSDPVGIFIPGNGVTSTVSSSTTESGITDSLIIVLGFIFGVVIIGLIMYAFSSDESELAVNYKAKKSYCRRAVELTRKF